MEFKNYIIGFLVFSLFLSVIFTSMSYMYSDVPGSYNLDLGDDEQVVQGYINLSQETYDAYYEQAFEIKDTSPGGNSTADNPEDVTQFGQDVSTWGVIWSIPSTFGFAGKAISMAAKTFSKYIPNKFFAIILLTILLSVILLIISVVRRYNVK